MCHLVALHFLLLYLSQTEFDALLIWHVEMALV